MKILRERWYYYIFIVFFIVVILFSILQARSYFILTSENDLEEEISLFVSNISVEYDRFESDMIYNSSIGTFQSVLESEVLESQIKEKIRRVYSMNIDIIDKIIVYNENTLREFVIEDSNYFKVSPLINTNSENLYKVKTYQETDDSYNIIIPIYNTEGDLESNVLIEINIDDFLMLELKGLYLGESSWAWYYDSLKGLNLLGESTNIVNASFELTDIDYILSRLEKGYKGKLRNELILDEKTDVISSFYPIKLGVKEFAVGFSVSQDMILGRINSVIYIIVLSFIMMIVLIVLLFLKLINDEINIKQELKKSNDTLDKILKEIPTTIIIHKENLVIEYINDFGKRLLGIDSEDSYGYLSIEDKFTNFTLENRDDVKYAISTSEKKISVMKYTVPIEYYGKQMYLTSVVDISGIEEARKLAEESNRLKSEFIANISHEIRTPMNGIIASAEILKSMGGSIEQIEYVDIIEHSANHLMVIINDILDLSKIESGKLIIEEIQFNARETIESVYDQFIVKANQKKIEIINDINVNVPNDLIGDPNRLKQVLTNLIGNAVKFTNSGFVYIGVDLEKISNGYAKILFTIADTGIGISEEALVGIFEPFIQADGSITRTFGGTGLGTTISKKIVNEMGGTISVESPNTLFKSSSKGTVFTFDINFKLADSDSRTNDEAGSFEGLNALVIEDNPINLKIIERMLKTWGVKIVSATSMEEAIESAKNRESDFDVLITDMILGSVYSDEIIGKLEELNVLPDYVVIVSSDSNYNRVASLRNKGFDIILKPIKQTSLYNVFKLYNENIKSRKKNILKSNQFDKDGRLIESDLSSHSIESKGLGSEEDFKYIKGKILVAEDNAINMKIILKYLSRFDLEILKASNGQEALDILAKDNVDLVFMDLQMPIMNGIDATEIIRKDNKELTIIAMTANAMEVHKKAIYEVGMNDFLSKPLKFDDIKNMLIKHLLNQ